MVNYVYKTTIDDVSTAPTDNDLIDYRAVEITKRYVTSISKSEFDSNNNSFNTTLIFATVEDFNSWEAELNTLKQDIGPVRKSTTTIEVLERPS